jgi:hypothetical protein
VFETGSEKNQGPYFVGVPLAMHIWAAFSFPPEICCKEFANLHGTVRNGRDWQFACSKPSRRELKQV